MNSKQTIEEIEIKFGISKSNPECPYCKDTPKVSTGLWRIGSDANGSFWEHKCKTTHQDVGFTRIYKKES